MKTILLFTALTLSTGTAYTKACSTAAFNSADAMLPLHTWHETALFFDKFKQCDEGYIAEGVSDTVSALLAKQWDALSQLQTLVDKNPGFEEWVAAHINTTANAEDLKWIIRNASEQCPKQSAPLCKKITLAAKQALKEMKTKESAG